jgi:hypothetical protein
LRPQEAVFYFSKALELAKVYEGEARVQATVDNIIKLLNRAKLLLKAQKERHTN